MRVGLVLGGGGVRGAAWLMGALHGLVAETGWDPATADLVIGTSAGAVVAALTTAGARPWDSLAPERQDLLRSLHRAASFRPELSPRSLGPGSLELALIGWRSLPGEWIKIVAGMAPQGVMSTRPIADLIAHYVPGGWPEQALWVVATDYRTGRRVAFGRPGGPAAELPQAVAASCAIPGFYRPVGAGGRLYVDGGVSSAANLDLAAEEALDLVVCLNPLSSPPDGANGPVSRVRAILHEQLVPQMHAVERSGSRLVVIEPSAASIRLIGINPMSRRRGEEIGMTASDEVRQILRSPATRRKLVLLSAGALEAAEPSR